MRIVSAITYVLACSVAAAQIPDLGMNASLHGKTVFPADNPWNRDISGMAVDPASDSILAAVGLLPINLASREPLGAPIPYIVVPGGQARVGVTFTNGAQSDRGPYPIPPGAPIEGGPDSTGDRHVIAIDRDRWMLYELFSAYPKPNTTAWWAGSGAIFDLNSNAVRPAGWTSADAAGLPIFPGLARYDEVFELGEIAHALRVTVPATSRAYLFPARHFASKLQDKNLPAMGLRVRLKASYDISGFPAEAQTILRALKKYGMLVADNAARRPYWELICTPDERWNDAALQTLREVTTADLEVVKRGLVEPVFDGLLPGPASLVGGPEVTAAVTLNGPAPEGGLTIAVSSDQACATPEAASIFIPAGATSAKFPVHTGPVATSMVATLRVSAAGYEVWAKVTVKAPAFSSLKVSPASARGGRDCVGSVNLSGPAPAGGLAVTLTSSASCASVPASVVVPVGSASVGFTVRTSMVGVKTAVTITAKVGTVTRSVGITVTP